VDRQRGEEESDAEEEDGLQEQEERHLDEGPPERDTRAERTERTGEERREEDRKRQEEVDPLGEDGDGRQDLRREEDLPEERAVRQERGGSVGDRGGEPVPRRRPQKRKRAYGDVDGLRFGRRSWKTTA
jgi:hypothetical protein